MLKKKLGVEAVETAWDLFLHKYYKISPTLIIPEGCVRLGIYAFQRCKILKKSNYPKIREND